MSVLARYDPASPRSARRTAHAATRIVPVRTARRPRAHTPAIAGPLARSKQSLRDTRERTAWSATLPQERCPSRRPSAGGHRRPPPTPCARHPPPRLQRTTASPAPSRRCLPARLPACPHLPSILAMAPSVAARPRSSHRRARRGAVHACWAASRPWSTADSRWFGPKQSASLPARLVPTAARAQALRLSRPRARRSRVYSAHTPGTRARVPCGDGDQIAPRAVAHLQLDRARPPACMVRRWMVPARAAGFPTVHPLQQRPTCLLLRFVPNGWPMWGRRRCTTPAPPSPHAFRYRAGATASRPSHWRAAMELAGSRA